MASEQAWSALDNIHAVVYDQSNFGDTYAKLGLDHPWMSYFASRSAPLGTASAELVIATFFGFSPGLIHRYVPQIWELTSPADVLAARLEVAGRGLAAVDDSVAQIADSLTEVLSGLTLAGASLAAAHKALPVPDSPVLKLWHAASVLREYRGDRHWAVLTAAGLNGASANALAVATGRYSPNQQKISGWREPEWTAAFGDLAQRGWVDSEHNVTQAGIAARNQLEDATSRVTMAGLDNEATARLITLEAALVGLAAVVNA